MRAERLSDLNTPACDSHSLYLFLSICREQGGHKLLTELQADTEAECGGVSRQGKSRQEEEVP